MTSATESNAAIDARPALAYEDFSNLAGRHVLRRAETVMRDGWTHAGKYAPLRLDEPFPWDDSDDTQSARNFHMHAWDMLGDVLHAFSLEGDIRYLRAAARVADDWIGRFPAPAAEAAYFAWYDMAVGLRAYRLAYLIDALERIDGRVDDALWNSLQAHADYLADDANIIFHNNHGLYQVAGQLAMGRRFEARLPAMGSARAQGEARLHRMIDAQFTPEGVHREHSPDYHRMVCDTLKGIAHARLIGDAELRQRIVDIEEALAWMVTPDGLILGFGDSDARAMERKPDDALAKWDSESLRFVASAGRVGTPPETHVRAFQGSGYFIARDRWPHGADDFRDGSYLALMAAFHSRAHKHADDLSIVWFENGRPILVDAGRFGYLGKAEPGSELWRDGYWYSHPSRVYVESTRAHNTVEIDGLNHPRRSVRAYGSALGRSGESAQGIIFCEAEVRHHRNVRFVRTLLWRPKEWLIVFDWLRDAAAQAHDFRQWFHFAPDLDVAPRADGFVVSREGTPVLGMLPLLGGTTPMHAFGVTEPRLQGFHSPEPNVLVPNHAAGFEQCQVDHATFATLFLLDGSDAAVDGPARVSGSGQSLVVAWRGQTGRQRLSLKRTPGLPIQIDHSRSA